MPNVTPSKRRIITNRYATTTKTKLLCRLYVFYSPINSNKPQANLTHNTAKFNQQKKHAHNNKKDNHQKVNVMLRTQTKEPNFEFRTRAAQFPRWRRGRRPLFWRARDVTTCLKLTLNRLRPSLRGHRIFGDRAAAVSLAAKWSSIHDFSVVFLLLNVKWQLRLYIFLQFLL